MIEAYFPALPKIELFACGKARPGWTAWGNEFSVTGIANTIAGRRPARMEAARLGVFRRARRARGAAHDGGGLGRRLRAVLPGPRRSRKITLPLEIVW